MAINLYCRIPFGRIHVRNPEIIQLAEKLGRTPGSISYKLANFASLDPSLDRRGAANVSKLDREVWNEFFEDWGSMVYESELKTAELFGREEAFQETLDPSFKEGETREQTVQARVNQRFFRKMVLSNYDQTCCITGLANPDLLVASHIVPWSRDTRNRLNPMNGLCLNALHDRAFDRGLIAVSPDYEVMVSSQVNHDLFQKYKGRRLTLPRRFQPDPAFLEFHRKEVFVR
ncbi:MULTISPECIES: HNH endonuclease [unclassified Nitrospina]|uniref:HNH endonuclease n=1 Tax=unclassified Nitrospina TaxID=2638683 RepID=UPI003F95EACB